MNCQYLFALSIATQAAYNLGLMAPLTVDQQTARGEVVTWDGVAEYSSDAIISAKEPLIAATKHLIEVDQRCRGFKAIIGKAIIEPSRKASLPVDAHYLAVVGGFEPAFAYSPHTLHYGVSV